MRKIMLAAAMLSMAGCATYKNDNKPLYEYPGIQSQIENYYDDNATEDDWVCGAVQMDTIDDSKVVAQSPTQVKMAITYFFTAFAPDPLRLGTTARASTPVSSPSIEPPTVGSRWHR